MGSLFPKKRRNFQINIMLHSIKLQKNMLFVKKCPLFSLKMIQNNKKNQMNESGTLTCTCILTNLLI